MQKEVVQFNRFDGGVTSELRSQYEVQKFARMWNFDTSATRAIQHYGLTDVVTGECHIVEYDDNFTGLTDQWLLNRPEVLAINASGVVTLIDGSCGYSTTSITLGKTVEMTTLPVVYYNHIVWLHDGATNYEVWIRDLSSGTETQVLTDVTDLDRYTFFQKGLDGRLYILSGFNVHRLEIADSNGNFHSSNELSPYQPISKYMQSPNRNGNVGTYTGLNGPETQIIDQIDELQSILSILGYYTGPIDGVFGPLTSSAVSAFQGDYKSTGNVPGGAAAGAPLTVDGIVGPETQAVLNAPDGNKRSNTREREYVLTLPDRITSVCSNGGVLNIGVKDKAGNGVVYYWDMSLSADGLGDQGLLTSVVVGQGVIQIIHPLNGRLMVIMTPATNAFCLSKYIDMSIYAIQGSFDIIPESYAVPLQTYKLRVGPNGTIFDSWRQNLINQKVIISNSKLYFSGRINFQHIQEQNDGEGVFSGVMSIDYNGNLFTEISQSNDSDDLTYNNIVSFGKLNNGFVIAGDTDVYITDKTNTDNVSGLITDIINAGTPWLDKKIDNIFLSMSYTDDLDQVEIWLRNIEDVDDSDAGWELAYRGDMQDSNSIQINKMNDGQPFWKFKELQIMVKVFGIGCELTNLSVIYDVYDNNK